MGDEDGFLSVVHCLLSLTSFSEILRQNKFPSSSLCSLLKVNFIQNISLGQQVPDLIDQLKYFSKHSSEGPTALLKSFVEEIDTFSSFPSSQLLFSSQDFIGLDPGAVQELSLRPERISILNIQWKTLQMTESLRVLSVLKSDAYIFTNGLMYIAMTRQGDKWTVFETTPIKNLPFLDSVKLMLLKGMHPVLAFSSYDSPDNQVLSLLPLAEKADSLLQCKFIPSVLEKKQSFSDTWNCKKCNRPISNTSYECGNCRAINWDKFYEIKAAERNAKRPTSFMSKTMSEKEITPTKSRLRPPTSPANSARKELVTETKNICATCNSSYTFKCLKCTQKEKPMESACQLCFAPNTVASKICWKCGEELNVEIKRRQKRDFTFGRPEA